MSRHSSDSEKRRVNPAEPVKLSAGTAPPCSSIRTNPSPNSTPSRRVCAVFARRRRVWIVAGGRRACFSRVYHRSAKLPEIASRREWEEFLALLRSADLIGSHNRRLRSLRALTSGYLPCTPPACGKNGQTPGAG